MRLKKNGCSSGSAGTLTSLFVCALALAALLLTPIGAQAAPYNLVSGNSSVFIDPASPIGMNAWVVDGIGQLASQWWFYRIGETNQAPIDTLAAPLVTQLSANVLDMRYVGQSVDVILRYTLTGGPPGSGNSTIAESLRIRNKTNAPIVFHLFEYTDLNLNGTPDDDTAALLNPTTIGQWDGAIISTETASVGGTTPLPNRWEIANAADLLNRLSTMPALDLADAATPFQGDAAFSFQWDMNIPAGGTQLLSKSKILARGGAIGDTVWFDSNGDGIQDIGEPGIKDVALNLAADFNGDGIIDYTDSTVTDDNGYYLFSNLPGGQYTITIDANTLPAGSIQTYDLDGIATPDTATITLNTGEVNLNVDFGYWQLASLGDFVWNDTNHNGIQDAGEPGIAGVTVDLYAADGVTLLATTTTDAGGKYSFSNLVPGGYVVGFVNPAGFVFSPQDQGGDDTKDSDASPTTGKTAVVTLASGDNNMTIDAGLSSQKRSSFTCDKTVNGVHQLVLSSSDLPQQLVYVLQACNTGETKLDLTFQDSGDLPPGGIWSQTLPYTFVGVAPGQCVQVTYTVMLQNAPGVLPGTGISLGGAGMFAVFGMNTPPANGTFINLSLVTVTGDVGVGRGGSCSFMAPSVVKGNIVVDSHATASGPGKFVGGGFVRNADLSGPNNDALAAYNEAKALAPTQTLGNITSGRTVVGNGGVNVLSIGSIKLGGSNNLVLKGTPNDVFILNITGGLDMGGSAQIVGQGVDASHILINVIGTGSTLTTHVGNMINGTVLAPYRSVSFHSANGTVVAGGKSITLMSGATVNFVPFPPGPQGFDDTLNLYAALSPGQANAVPPDPSTCESAASVIVTSGP